PDHPDRPAADQPRQDRGRDGVSAGVRGETAAEARRGTRFDLITNQELRMGCACRYLRFSFRSLRYAVSVASRDGQWMPRRARWDCTPIDYAPWVVAARIELTTNTHDPRLTTYSAWPITRNA